MRLRIVPPDEIVSSLSLSLFSDAGCAAVEPDPEHLHVVSQESTADQQTS